MENVENKSRRFPLYITKRMIVSKKKIWLIRVIGILVAFLTSGIIATIFKPGSFGLFYSEMFIGCFDPSDFTTIIDLLCTVSLYLLMTLALTPAFKMKFWNIGGEGQTLVGCLVAAGVLWFTRNSWPVALSIVVALVGSIAASIIWAVVPAIFKAFFNTNETLFTLMMNYIASTLVAVFIFVWFPNGTQKFPLIPEESTLAPIAEIDFLWPIIIVAIVTVLIIIYLKKSKHGYELSVVGSSSNTARYVGINVKKVIIRTMVLSGALCGLLGFLIVAGVERSLSPEIVGGKGFTAVLIAWLGHFEPVEMLLFSFLVGVFDQGSVRAGTSMGISTTHEFTAIITGLFFFVIIACEFFSNYQIKIRKKDVSHDIQEANKFASSMINGEQKQVDVESASEDKEDK